MLRNSLKKLLRSLGLLLLLTGLSLFGSRVYLEYLKLLNEPVTAWTTDPHADCGVVLTGGVNRIAEGFELLSQGRITNLIISGVNPQSKLEEIFPQWRNYRGVNTENIILEKRSNTTYGNAHQTAPIAEALKCTKVLLITSNLHMLRAYATFKSAFPEGVDIETYSVSTGKNPPDFAEVSNEVAKSLFYGLWAY